MEAARDILLSAFLIYICSVVLTEVGHRFLLKYYFAMHKLQSQTSEKLKKILMSKTYSTSKVTDLRTFVFVVTAVWD